VKCDCCDIEGCALFMVSAPESAWPMVRLCAECMDELSADDDARPLEPSCDCRDYCAACCPV
jgi:hypothetical protein